MRGDHRRSGFIRSRGARGGAPRGRPEQGESRRSLIQAALLVCLVAALSGCVPPRASVYVRDEPAPRDRFVTNRDDIYIRAAVYDRRSLAARLDVAPISHAEVYPVHGRRLEGRTIALCATDKSVPELRLDNSAGIPLDEVDRIVLFRRIPASTRRDDFLTYLLLGAVVSVVGEIADAGPTDWNRVALTLGVGSALGCPFLLEKEETLERVLVSFEPLK